MSDVVNDPSAKENLDTKDETKVEKKLNYDANSIDIGVWGVSVVLGGALYGWNAALVTGFGMYSLAQGFVLTFTFLCVGLKSL